MTAASLLGGRAGAIILAAGTGARLGLGPKAHVEWNGVPLLDRVVATCRRAGLAEVACVGRTDDLLLEGACRRVGATVRVNLRPEDGMASSVRIGLDLRAPWQVTLIWPVDFPAVQPETVRRLVDACPRDSWSRPVRAGTPGHPIGLGADLVLRLLDLDRSLPLREALSRSGAVPAEVETDDVGVLLNVNTPDDLEALARHGVRGAMQ